MVGFGPIEHALWILDDIPDKLGPNRVGVHLFELNQIIIELVEALVGSDWRIPGLIREATRNKILGGCRIPEITMVDLQDTFGAGRDGERQSPYQAHPSTLDPKAM